MIDSTPTITVDCPTCKFAKDHAWFGLHDGVSHCRDCHKYWTGTTACHCTICHETFASYFSSDMHWVRAKGKSGEGKHTHPSLVKGLVAVERVDHNMYWTKRT